MSAEAVPVRAVHVHDASVDDARVATRRRRKQRHVVAQTVLAVLSVIWLLPIVWTFYISLRPYADTQSSESLMGWPEHLNFDNYTRAWQQSDFLHFFVNSAIITIPAVIITLFLASLVAFAVSRYSFRFNLVLLLIFTAGNLLPPQIILVPLYRLYLLLPLPGFLNAKGVWYDSVLGRRRDPHRVPDGLRDLRAQQLHEGAADRAHRGSARRRRRRLDAVPQDHPAAVPPGARRARPCS